jgi:hypothetical protein
MNAPVAQRIEHLTTDQKVRGSNPFGRAQVKQVLQTVGGIEISPGAGSPTVDQALQIAHIKALIAIAQAIQAFQPVELPGTANK